MMTSLTAVDLFVWHESLGGGGRPPGLMSSSNLLLPGGSQTPSPCLVLGGVFFQSLSRGTLLVSVIRLLYSIFILALLDESIHSQSLSWGSPFLVIVQRHPSSHSHQIIIFYRPSIPPFALSLLSRGNLLVPHDSILFGKTFFFVLILWFIIKNHTLFVQSDFVLVLPWYWEIQGPFTIGGSRLFCAGTQCVSSG